jgi:gamma-glutamyltranspeptidase
MVYGSMGGDGQPQTQAALFTRYVVQGVPLQESITARAGCWGAPGDKPRTP